MGYRAGRLTPSYLGQNGIPFPASQNASSDPNTLDDYEEGTVTFTLGDGTNNYNLVLNDNSYTKIGRLVVVTVHLTWDSIGSAGASNLRITGLPFSVVATATEEAAMVFSSFAGLDMTAANTQMTAMVLDSDTNLVRFARMSDNAAGTFLPANTASASGGFGGVVIYFAAT